MICNDLNKFTSINYPVGRWELVFTTDPSSMTNIIADLKKKWCNKSIPMVNRWTSKKITPYLTLSVDTTFVFWNWNNGVAKNWQKKKNVTWLLGSVRKLCIWPLSAFIAKTLTKPDVKYFLCCLIYCIKRKYYTGIHELQ